jgi:hypothetical protein
MVAMFVDRNEYFVVGKEIPDMSIFINYFV